MKAALLVTAITLAFAGAPASAQQQSVETSTRDADSGAVQSNPALSALLTQDPRLTTPDLPLGKKLRVGGPLIRAFKARKIVEVPRRVLHLLNPFAPAQPGELLERTRDLNPHAWSTLVGLHPGGSAFADATTHESALGLVSVGR